MTYCDVHSPHKEHTVKLVDVTVDVKETRELITTSMQLK